MSFTRKNPEIFPHSLKYFMLINVPFQEERCKTTQFFISDPISTSVQLVLLSHQLSCLFSVKFLISNNLLWWILKLEKPYYPYFLHW